MLRHGEKCGEFDTDVPAVKPGFDVWAGHLLASPVFDAHRYDSKRQPGCANPRTFEARLDSDLNNCSHFMHDGAFVLLVERAGAIRNFDIWIKKARAFLVRTVGEPLVGWLMGGDLT